jgi:hypothetical protein
LDALILVAATAIGLAGLRASVGDLREVREELSESLAAIAAPPNEGPTWSWAIYSGYGLVVTVLVPFCWAWTLAFLALRLRRPRPPWRRLACQPGAIACGSAAFVLVPALVGLIFFWMFLPKVDFESERWQKCLGCFFILLPAMTGSTVLGAWGSLILGRRYRVEPSWIDRAGRLLGIYWIAAIFLPAWGLF